MKKILVTGSDGFIGSHLTEELVKQGYEVKAFVYYNSFNTWGWLDTLPKEIMEHVEIFQGGSERLRGGISSGGADSHSLQLSFSGHLRGHQHQGNPECPSGSQRPGNREGSGHIYLRGIRNGAVCSH